MRPITHRYRVVCVNAGPSEWPPSEATCECGAVITTTGARKLGDVIRDGVCPRPGRDALIERIGELEESLRDGM